MNRPPFQPYRIGGMHERFPKQSEKVFKPTVKHELKKGESEDIEAKWRELESIEKGALEVPKKPVKIPVRKEEVVDLEEARLGERLVLEMAKEYAGISDEILEAERNARIAKDIFEEKLEPHIPALPEEVRNSFWEKARKLGPKVLAPLSAMAFFSMVSPENSEAKSNTGKIVSALFGGEEISPEAAAYRLEGEALLYPKIAIVKKACSIEKTRDNKGRENCDAAAKLAKEDYRDVNYDHKNVDIIDALRNDGEISQMEAADIVQKENHRKDRIARQNKQKQEEEARRQADEKRRQDEIRSREMKEAADVVIDWESQYERSSFESRLDSKYPKRERINSEYPESKKNEVYFVVWKNSYDDPRYEMMHIAKTVGEGNDRRRVEIKVVQVLGEDLYGQSRGRPDRYGRRYHVIYRTGGGDWLSLRLDTEGLNDIVKMVEVEKERALGVVASDIERVVGGY